MAVSLESFLADLSQTTLLSRQELDRFLASCVPSPATAEALADQLVQAGHLTRFQVAMIQQGKGRSLTLGNYEIRGVIGAGGMGHVYLARHRHLKRLVALKVLPPRVTRDPRAVARFQREAQAASQLTHPNIVSAFDASHDKRVYYFVMEYVDGQDLASLLKTQGPFSISQAVSCTIQAARGLHYAHSCGIIHRDIKPANLLLDSQGTVKILDMGLARCTSREEDDTDLGVILGTVDFMAPEQALDIRQADARSDIYSLGCTFFTLLTGELVYSHATVKKKLKAMQTEPPPSLRSARPDVPPELEVVYQKMVARYPRDRFQSMAQVIVALESFSAGPPRDPNAGYGDLALREVLSPTEHTAATTAASSDAKLDFAFLRELSTDEYDQPQQRESRTLPRRKAKRNWKTRLVVLLLASAAIGGFLFGLLRGGH
jgi:serine/threonine protein kinase